jgi:hypothetical protein
VPTTMAALTSDCISPRTRTRRPDPICTNLPREPCAGRSKRIAGNVFVYMHSLRMLAKVVETGETAGTVTLEWSFASVFPIRC